MRRTLSLILVLLIVVATSGNFALAADTQDRPGKPESIVTPQDNSGPITFTVYNYSGIAYVSAVVSNPYLASGSGNIVASSGGVPLASSSFSVGSGGSIMFSTSPGVTYTVYVTGTYMTSSGIAVYISGLTWSTSFVGI